MERSQSGYIEPMTRGSRANAERVQKIIAALAPKFVDPPQRVIHVRAATDPETGEVFSMMNPRHRFDPVLDTLPDGSYLEIALREAPPEHGFNINGDYV